MADNTSAVLTPAGFLDNLVAFSEDIAKYGGAMTSALSEAAARYAEGIGELHAAGIYDAEREFQAACDAFGKTFGDLSAQAKTWAEAADNAHNPGIGDIMRKYADGFAAKAEGLLSDVGSAASRWGALAADAQKGLEDAGKLFGGGAGKWAGPIVDGAQMAAGAYNWAATGESASFGQACSGLLFSAGGGLLGLGVAGLLGLSGAAVAVPVAIGALAGSLIGGPTFDAAKDQLGKWVGDFGEWSGLFPALDGFLGGLGALGDAFAGLFGGAFGWTPPRCEPLALDLDGDGLETVGVTATSQVLFDHDGNGIKTASGWLKGDDAWLVLDRNGNGLIDNGSELFGDETVLQNGSKAADGFAALADLDSNHDAQFDNRDTQYANVQVWRDLDQDGVSDAGELQSLEAAGVAQVSLAATVGTLGLAGGNLQTAASTYTRSDGSTGKVADLTLVENSFYREFINKIPLTAEAAKLPEMHGAGAVRDLREAASLSSALAADVAGLDNDLSRTDMLARLDKVLQDWAATSDFKTSRQIAAGMGLNLLQRNSDALNQTVCDRMVIQSCLKGFLIGFCLSIDTKEISFDFAAPNRQAMNDGSWRCLA